VGDTTCATNGPLEGPADRRQVCVKDGLDGSLHRDPEETFIP
jgi:hypothetical protein